MRPSAHYALALIAALLLASCGGELAGESMTSDASKEASIPATLSGLIKASVGAPWRTPYAGVRHIVAHLDQDGADTLLSYHESVVADGKGRFAIQPGETESYLPDPALFKLQQKAREGFLYRYRDFAIRDFNAFAENYLVTDLDADLTVAGRACRLARIERVDGAGSIYTVALDAVTGLILRSEERGADGAELGRMEFETYDGEPDLGGVVWFVPDHQEEALDSAHNLDEQLDFEAFEPGLTPAGYKLWKAATLVDDEGDQWLKQTFTDGVEPLFFFHRAEASGGAATGPMSATAVGTGKPMDELWVYPIGRLTAIEGVLRQRDVIVLGKLDSESLLDLLEFSID